MENFEKIRKEIAALSVKRESANLDLMLTNGVKEYENLSRKLSDLTFRINELDRMLDAKLKVVVSEKFRCFDVCEFDIPIRKGEVNYIMGDNGCGKTTVLQRIRSEKDSLENANKKTFDGMYSTNIQMMKFEPIEVIGINENFTHVFALDSVEDDPSSFINSATAMSFISGGGMTAQHISKGEKAKRMLGSFLYKIQNELGYSIEKHKNGETLTDVSPLVIVDEIDEGMDFSNMMGFDHMLNNLCRVFNATILCVTHNPFVLFGSNKGNDCQLFDMDKKKQTTVKEFVESKTGISIDVQKPKK